jgi:hypothetical protein
MSLVFCRLQLAGCATIPIGQERALYTSYRTCRCTLSLVHWANIRNRLVPTMCSVDLRTRSQLVVYSVTDLIIS